MDPGETKPEGTTVFGTLDRHQERSFPGSAPAAFAASPFPAPVGVIDLDGPVQRAFVVPFLHDLEDLNGMDPPFSSMNGLYWARMEVFTTIQQE